MTIECSQSVHSIVFTCPLRGGSPVKQAQESVSVYSRVKIVREHSFRIGQSIFSIEHSIDGLCFHQAAGAADFNLKRE